MYDLNKLPDISTLDDIEVDFKVYAGPGAGKTTWLISHLERVLRKSKRLERTRKIACITYTNVAAEEVINNLNCDRSRFDISTIHSFLYRNIVKPFSFLIENDSQGESLFNISKLEGHDEHIVHGDRLRRWIHTISSDNNKNYNVYQSPQNKPKVVGELSSLDYEFEQETVKLIIRKNRGARIPKTNNELWKYKLKYWSDGIMHHEDVLYFSYLILSQHPTVLSFIRSKFPYIFVDEFQDTTQLQTWILGKIAEDETVIGGVGDLAQSIYKFTGAQRKDFLEFKTGNIREFKLSKNYRSTPEIIDFLNLLRTDIHQEYGAEQKNGNQVKVLVGSPNEAIDWFRGAFEDEKVFTLTRKNDTVFGISNQLGVSNEDLLKDMYSNDSSADRSSFIHAVLKAIKFFDKHDFANALKEIVRHLKRTNDGSVLKLDLRNLAINMLNDLSKDERNIPLYNFYMDIQSTLLNEFGLKIGAALHSGSAKEFYENYTINDLLPHIKVDTKSDDLIRTIHSAKGTEFNNTLVHFEALEDFKKYIINGTEYLDNEEDDGRIYYVACSRAKKNLFLNIPEITQDELDFISDLQIDIVNLSSP